MSGLHNATKMESSDEGKRPGSMPIPVLLLKTKSTPHDGYEECFSLAKRDNEKWAFESVFVPVLTHGFQEKGMTDMRNLLATRKISGEEGACYGGLIFTSQRAVEAFSKLIMEGQEQNGSSEAINGWPQLQGIPVYTVGPATSRALRNIPQKPPLDIFGSETGNGEELAHYMLDHYTNWYADRPIKPPLLFLVGEQRRDIIPKILMDSSLDGHKKLVVEELIVYETDVMQSFEHDFGVLLKQTENSEIRWVVVFSPTGCEAMLKAVDLIDAKSGKVKTGERGGGCGIRKGRRRTYIATIGPTTRDYLRKKFGFEPDVCAETPSPDGIKEGIEKFMEQNIKD